MASHSLHILYSLIYLEPARTRLHLKYWLRSSQNDPFRNARSSSSFDVGLLQGRRQGGSWVARDPPFCKPFLTKEPITDGENAMTISWPSLKSPFFNFRHGVTPPLKSSGYTPVPRTVCVTVCTWFERTGHNTVTRSCHSCTHADDHLKSLQIYSGENKNYLSEY